MNFEQFLSEHNADVPTIIQNVEEIAGVGPGDILLAVGSLVDGLGTSKSDLDLLLLVQNGESSSLQADNSAWLVGNSIVDLRVLPIAEVEALLTNLSVWAQRPWSVSQAAKFTYDERILLHRLLHSRQLSSSDCRGHLQSYIPPRSELARLKLHVARHLARTIQVDMVGYRSNCDYRSLVFAAQELLGHAADALLAGHELTNPTCKWRNRLLESLPADWERPLVTRYTGLSAAQLFWHLHRAPNKPEKELALRHALRSVGFARAVFAWAESRLLGRSVQRPSHYTWSSSERQLGGSSLPNLELDVDFHFSGGKVALSRLNEFSDSIEITEREFAILLMCDSATTDFTAENIPYSSKDQGGPLDGGQVIARAIDAGLCLGTNSSTSSRS